MADSALSSDPLERYGAIERAYCEERWTSVIYDGQTLLGDLSRVDAAPPEGLKERLQLLIGHAFLYGLGDRDSAEDHYQAVLRSEAEASLRQIAEQGLQQCGLPVAPAEPQAEQPEPEDQPDGLVAAPTAETSVWQEAATSESPPDPASPLEADTALRRVEEGSPPLQVLQDSWDAPTPQAPFGDAGPMSWLSAEATEAPPDSAVLPVMPWLEAAAPVGAASVEPGVADGEAAPALSPETAASLQATAAAVAAAFQPPVAGQPAQSPVVLAAQEDRWDNPLASPELAEPAPEGRDALDAPSAGPSPSVVEQRLVADVVVEPELIELHEADSVHSEELLVETESEASPPPSLAEVAMPQAPAPEAPEPAAGLDRRGSDRVFSDGQDRRAEPAPAERPELDSASSQPQDSSGMRPFSAPPEPVAEEDPELLMGLLKVEMG